MPSSTCTPSSLDTAAGRLVFRICSRGREGQIVRVRSPKCTIGSGPRCTLRLRAAGVEPLHCLIVRGQAATVIRRWSADTRLNGEGFTDAELVPGDRLSIGTIELEVLDAGWANRESAAAELAALEEQRNQLAQQRSQLEESQNSLETQRQAMAKELAQWETQRQALEEDRTQWETQRQAVEEDRRRWEAERSQCASQSAEQSQQSAARLAELDAQSRSLQEKQQQWEAEREQLQGRLHQQTEQFDSLRAELDARQRATAEPQPQWETQRQSLEEDRRLLETEKKEAADRATEQSQQYAARLAEVEAQARLLQEKQQRWEAERVECERQLQERQAALETWWDALKARSIQEGGLQEDGQPAEDEPEALEAIVQPERLPSSTGDARPEVAAPPEAPANAPPVHHTEEESIDAYMQRLMERVRGGSGNWEPPAARPQAPSPPAAPELPRPAKAEAKPPESPKPLPGKHPQVEPLELSPRTVAPEKQGGLSAMRELANLSAQSALSDHAHGQLLRATRVKLLVALVGLVAAGAMMGMWGALRTSRLTFYGGLIGLGVAAYWGIQYAVLSGRFLKFRRRP